TYKIYRSTSPITAANIGQAQLLATLPEGTSAYQTERMRAPDYPPDWNGGYVSLRNFIIEPFGSQLSDDTGLFVWTTHENQTSHYAVTTVAAGRENQSFLAAGNTAGPIAEAVADPSPIPVWESASGRGRVYTQFMDYSNWNPTYETPDGLTYAYNYFVGLPGPDVCNGPPPEQHSLVLHIEGYGTRYEAGDGSHYFCAIELWCDDPRQSWYYGYSATHDYSYSDALVTTGPIVNFTEQRLLRAVYDVVRDSRYNVDEQRIYAYGHSMGASGALALGMRYPNVFAATYSSEPMTDFRSSTVFASDDCEPKWGSIDLNLPIENRGRYAGHLAQYDGLGVWDWQNHQDQLVQRRGDEMAFISLAHGTQDTTIEWDSQGRLAYEPFYRSQRAFSAQVVTEDHTWIGFYGMGPTAYVDGSPFSNFQFLRDESLPGLTNASGSLPVPPPGVGGYNMNLEWSASWDAWDGPPFDSADSWGISLRTTDGSTQTVDVTPRRLQHFTITSGEVYTWQNLNVESGAVVATGTVLADADGLVTIPQFQVSPGGNRVRLFPGGTAPTATPTLRPGQNTPTPTRTPTRTPSLRPTATPTVSGPATVSVPIEIRWPEGVTGTIPVTVGIPLPPGSWNPSSFTIAGPQGPVPSQIRSAANAGPNGNASVLLVDFQAEHGGTYRLETGTAPEANVAIEVEHLGNGGLRIDTGAGVFTVVPNSSLFGEILGSEGTTLVTGAGWGVDPVVAEVELVESGPIRAMVCVRAQEAVYGLDMVARIHFFAGLPYVRVRLTLVNHNQAVFGWEDPEASNGDCGVQPNQPIIQGLDCPRTIVFDDITWSLSLADADLPTELLYQDSSGTDRWNFYVGQGPRMQSGATRRGYIREREGQAQETGNIASGTIVTGGIRLDVPWFRELFPKALRTQDGQVQFGIFPGEFSIDHRLRPGEQKTHDVWIGLDPDQPAPWKALAHPSLSWLRSTHGLGYIGPRVAGEYFDYEDYLDAQFDPTRENTDGFAPSVNDAQIQWDLFGWTDFGDLPTDLEDGRSPYNLKYDVSLGFLHQAFRTGEDNWWRWAEISNRHFADIDIFHSTTRGYDTPRQWHEGGAWGHSLHDESGLTNPHRNCNNPHPDLYYGFTGMAAWALLTGDDVVRDAALEMAENTLWRVLNTNSPCATTAWGGGNGEGYAVDDDAVSLRGAANAARIMTWAWRLTGDRAYLDGAAGTARWYMCTRDVFTCGSWQAALFVRALGEYILAARDAGIDVEPQAVPALEHALQNMADNMERSGDRAWFDGCTGREVNAWMLLAADAFALGYAVTGDSTWLTEYAVPSFNTGSEDPFYEGDHSNYHSSKELVNAVAAGTIFLHFIQDTEPSPQATATPTIPSVGTATPTPPPHATPTRIASPTPLSLGAGRMVFQRGVSPGVGYMGVADVVITSLWATNTQLGRWEFLSTFRDDQERHRILIRFDLSALPDSALVQRAVLSLYTFDHEYDDSDQTVTLHRLTAPWAEGTGDFEFPDDTYIPDGATWTLADASTPWTQAGGDFNTAVISEMVIPAFAQAGWTEFDATNLVGDWISRATPNYGLMIRSQDAEWSGHRFYSSEYENASLRPKLTVDYVIPTPTPGGSVGVDAWRLY
ncbi:MAG: DNRLRE domain-containing protein, partial [bacterium]